MPVFLFDRTDKVLLVRMPPAFAPETLVSYNKLLQRFVTREGPTRSVVDFSLVEKSTVPTGELQRRARLAPLAPEHDSVYVVPRADLYGLGRMFGTYHRLNGHREPRIVHTMPEAYAALGLTAPDFQPVTFDD